MELLILDKDFEELGTIELFSSLIWIRRYYQPGSFELHCNMLYFNLLDEGVYLFRSGYELAVIDGVGVERSYTGETSVKATGNFIETILNDRALPGEQSFSGTREAIAHQIVNTNMINPSNPKRRVNALKLSENRGQGGSTTIGTENDYVGDVLYAMLKDAEFSQSIDYDYLTNTLSYRVWQGKDRTDSQEENSYAVFSDDLENVVDDNYSIDRSDYKNFCYVVGKDGAVVEVDKTGEDFRRRELVVTAYDSDNAVLTSEGNMQLGKNKVIELFDGRIATNANFIYREDWDLGDLCTFRNTNINKIADKRITEIKEVYEDGEVEIYPKFGDDYITINQKIKREVKR